MLELDLGGTELDDFAFEDEDLTAGLELLETGALLDDEGASLDENTIISTWFEKWISVFLMRENELELLLEVLSGVLMISMVPEGLLSLSVSSTSPLQAATTMKMATSMYPLILVIL